LGGHSREKIPRSYLNKKLGMVASTCYLSHRGGANWRTAKILEGFATLPIFKNGNHCSSLISLKYLHAFP
jgi:hypothetical protein